MSAIKSAKTTASEPDGDERTPGPPDFPYDDIAILREESRETLELLRSLVKLLMPRGDDGGPKLEDLIAALVAQQRDILVGVRQLQSDMGVLLERSDRDHNNGQSPVHSDAGRNSNGVLGSGA